MNNAELRLTQQPVTVSGTGTSSLPLSQTARVLEFDSGDLVLTMLALSATSAPTATVEIWSGMQTDTADGWYKVANWAEQTAASTAGLKLNVAGFAKYIIWKIVLGAGSGTPSCTFFISGVLRCN